MKLKNKKTSAIYDIDDIDLSNGVGGIWIGMNKYNSLAELCEEWEDYEKPKEYWYICTTSNNEIMRVAIDDGTDFEGVQNDKEIGNYFETKEEAEKTVRKLQAWKRLKDKGFKFEGWEDSPTEDDFNMIWFTMKAKVWDTETREALDLLFSQGDGE